MVKYALFCSEAICQLSKTEDLFLVAVKEESVMGNVVISTVSLYKVSFVAIAFVTVILYFPAAVIVKVESPICIVSNTPSLYKRKASFEGVPPAATERLLF